MRLFIRKRNSPAACDSFKSGLLPLLRDNQGPGHESPRCLAGGFQIGGGIHDENAEEFLRAGASQVIVTSFVFKEGQFKEENLNRLVHAVGKEQLVLDLSLPEKRRRLLYRHLTAGRNLRTCV